MIVINENGRELTVGSRGYNLEIAGRKKYFGLISHAVDRFGWNTASELLKSTIENELKDFSSEIYPKKTRISWEFNGIAGKYRSTTYPHNRGVILDLVAFTDSHLAKSETTSNTVFPSTHAQSAVRMIAQDIESKAFKDGAFETEEALVAFIKEREAMIRKAMMAFTLVEGGNEEASDEDRESDEDSEADAA